MSFEAAAFPALILVIITSVLLLLLSDWRYNLAILAMQCIGVFLLVGLSWPLAMAISLLVAGWIAAAVLGMAMLGLQSTKGEARRSARQAAGFRISSLRRMSIPSQVVFQLAAAVVMILTLSTLVGRLSSALGELRQEIAWACLILLGMGILKLGFNARPFPIVIGLLTFVSGFTVLYAALETSALVAGLVSVVTLGLALAGAYLVNSPMMEEED